MKKLLQAAAVVALGVGLTGGIASAATGAVDVAGVNSDVKVTSDTESSHRHRNNNTFRAANNNPQSAKSGHADQHHTDGGGAATTGMASNDSTLDASLTLDNGTGAVGGAALENDMGDVTVGGVEAKVNVKSTAKQTINVVNNNDLKVENNNHQTATSGNATVHHSVDAGDATTGDATNTSTATITFDVMN